jgi:hypothetical protein
MAMQRKPAPAGKENVDDFIRGASTEIVGAAIPTETPGKRSEPNSHKHLQQTSAVPSEMTDVAEFIGRGSVFAEKFKRETFYIHKDLVKAINKKAAQGGKGEKTRIINRALQKYLTAEE